MPQLISIVLSDRTRPALEVTHTPNRQFLSPFKATFSPKNLKQTKYSGVELMVFTRI